MIIAAHQPNFFPYLGLFYKIYKSDAFIFVDDVQFSNQRGISHHRNYIKTPNGKEMIMIPVVKRNGMLIKEVTIDNSYDWRKKLLRKLQVNYSKSKYYVEVISWIEDLLYSHTEKISEFNIYSIKSICERMGINRSFYISSDKIIEGRKEDYVLNLIESFGGTVYYSGTGAASYLHKNNFKNRGMNLIYSDYSPIHYTQLWGDYIENLSVVDYLFNCGFKNPF